MRHYDLHMHSHFSMDSEDSMEKMVKASVERGLKEICFTDHVEFYTGVAHRNAAIFDAKAYVAEIERLREVYHKKIDIRIGVEFGYQPQSVEKINHFSKLIDFDFIICSVHEVKNQAFHVKEYGNDKTIKEAFETYFLECERCTRENLLFSVLGHFDLLKRYVPCGDGAGIFKDNFDLIESIFKRLISNGKGIEVNTSGFRYGLGQTHPTSDFLKLYKSLGGEIITMGSDAHTAEYVGDKFEYTVALLKEIGFDYITRFEKLKPKFVKI